MIKKARLILYVTLVLMVISFEVGLRLFWHGADATAVDPGNSKQQALGEALKQKSKFYQDRFCDSVHQTKLGETQVAQCMAPEFEKVLQSTEKNPAKIFALGASTTHGFNCDSQTSWPTELSNLEKQNILNLADDGAYSDESIKKLEAQLEKGNIPDFVIWSHGMTEFLFYGDERDINWLEINKDAELMGRLKKEVVYKENFILKVLRFDITIQKYWYGYRFLRVMGNLTALNLKNGYRKFVMGQTDGNMEDMNEREKYIAGSGIFNGPVRMIFSAPALDYAIKNYGLNLERLKAAAEKSKFKVMCIKIPNVKGLLIPFSQEFGVAFDNWIERVNNFTVEKCQQLGFPIADVHQCYLNEAAKAEVK